MDYNRKIDFAIKLLRSIPQDGPIEISYSGGKDSDVILRLAQMAGIPHEAIYKQTSIDPPFPFRLLQNRIMKSDKSSFIKIIAWILFVLLGLGIVTDVLCQLGLNRGWQYIYNAASFIVMPLLLYVALRDVDIP